MVMFGLLLAVIIFWGGAVAGYSAAAKVGGNSWQAAMVGLSIGVTSAYLLLFMNALCNAPDGVRATFRNQITLKAIRDHGWTSIAFAFYATGMMAGYMTLHFMITEVKMKISTINMVSMACAMIPTLTYSVVVAKEKLTPLKFAGASMMMVGCSLLGFSGEAAETSSLDLGCVNITAGGSDTGSGDGDCIAIMATDGSGSDSSQVAGSSRVVKGVIIIVAMAITWGTNTIILTYAPRRMASVVLQDFLIFLGGLFAVVVAVIVFIASTDSNTLPTFDAKSVGGIVGAIVCSCCFGNLAYMTLARRGAEGSLMMPLSMLYPLVGVLVGVVLGETVSLLPGIGISIILVSAVALSSEMMSSSKPELPEPYFQSADCVDV